MGIDAKLKREDEAGNPHPWALVADALNLATALSDPVIEYGLRAAIGETTDAEAAANGTLIAILKRIRTLIATTNSTLLGTLQADITNNASRVLGKVSIDGFPAGETGLAKDATATAIRDRLPSALESGRLPVAIQAGTGLATDATLSGLRGDVAKDATVTAVRDKVQALLDSLGAVAASPATNTVQDRLKAVYGAVSGLEGILTAIRDRAALLGTEATLTTRASEATLTQVRDRLPSGGAAAESTLAALKARADLLATEATLTQVRDRLPSGTGLATEDTLSQIEGHLDTVEGSIDGLEAQGEPLLLGGQFTGNGQSYFATIDLSRHRWISVHFRETGVMTIQFEQSGDGTTWVPCPLMDASATGGSPVTALTTVATATNQMFSGSLNGKFFRLRSSAFTSGTIDAQVVARVRAGTDSLVALSDLKRGLTDYRTLMEWYEAATGIWKVRYVGKNLQATATSAATWLVQRLTWTQVATGIWKVTDVQVLTGSWDSRATLGWT